MVIKVLAPSIPAEAQTTCQCVWVYSHQSPGSNHSCRGSDYLPMCVCIWPSKSWLQPFLQRLRLPAYVCVCIWSSKSWLQPFLQKLRLSAYVCVCIWPSKSWLQPFLQNSDYLPMCVCIWPSKSWLQPFLQKLRLSAYVCVYMAIQVLAPTIPAEAQTICLCVCVYMVIQVLAPTIPAEAQTICLCVCVYGHQIPGSNHSCRSSDYLPMCVCIWPSKSWLQPFLQRLRLSAYVCVYMAIKVLAPTIPAETQTICLCVCVYGHQSPGSNHSCRGSDYLPMCVCIWPSKSWLQPFLQNLRLSAYVCVYMAIKVLAPTIPAELRLSAYVCVCIWSSKSWLQPFLQRLRLSAYVCVYMVIKVLAPTIPAEAQTICLCVCVYGHPSPGSNHSCRGSDYLPMCVCIWPSKSWLQPFLQKLRLSAYVCVCIWPSKSWLQPFLQKLRLSAYVCVCVYMVIKVPAPTIPGITNKGSSGL